MRSVKLIAAFVLGASLFLSRPALVTTARPQGQTRTIAVEPCDLSAYVIDPDPKGLNVRSGPAHSYKVIGNLPNQSVEGIGVHITGSSDEWVRIDRAVEEGSDPERTVFSGEGWVYGPLLGVDGVGWVDGGTPLYQGPTKSSRVLMRMPVEGKGAVVRGCRGKWMYVEHKGVRGWARGEELCANALTTCS